MGNYIESGSLKIDSQLHNFVKDKVLPNLNISGDDFWAGFETSLKELAPKNKALLEVREELQAKQDEWHKANPGPIADFGAYKSFLNEIGYMDEVPADFSISGNNLDPEIAKVAGAQLVVPINNARYALNAANARWGSLYDALYGTDAIAPTSELGKTFDKMRGEKVIKWGREFLDQHFALLKGSHQGAKAYKVVDQKLVIILEDGSDANLANNDQLIGYQGDAASPSGVVLVNNGLHIIIEINADHPIGKDDAANVADIKLESAMSTIMDCEDSVAATNAEEKIGVYSNWLGLMQSNLSIEMEKNGKKMVRALNGDIDYTDLAGNAQKLKGRSLMLIRNVGHLMTTDAILLDGEEIGEGLMDAFITSLISLHNQKSRNQGHQNSIYDSLYVVKPKMHGAKEVAFANETFNHVEKLLGLAPNTIKVGIMDEERRTSVNLKACINEVKDRVFFINTGFLDRTGDEIHTCMHAGPIMLKGDIKNSTWIAAYEARNAQIGLNCGFNQKAQIGKGMWAMPDEMKAMMEQKIGHLKAGATTAWVPSPTAATLHATHYHQLNVSDVQNAMDTTETDINQLLTIPVCNKEDLSPADVEQDLKLNCQGILGYVVRWIDQGVGCSKVPDLNDVGLMEDRATLRISSQHIANWLHHGVCTKEQVMSILEEMAAKVDEQNKDDALYQNMSGNFDSSIAYEASVALIFEGMVQPSGYTEPLLHGKRRKLLDTQ